MARDLRASERMATDPRTSPSGRRVLAGRYRLLVRIDEGGAGEVWRARDERLGRDVAVKILGKDADEAFRARFAEEARRAAAVIHPNVVTVFDEGRDRGDAFMVMELVPGKTLREVITERGPLPPHEASRLVTQVGAALDAAHAAGVVHCDVKPANVIVDPSGSAKLTDFGIARAARDSEEQVLLGTARYIAPERVEGGPVTPRTDVYGLGLLAYELLAGQPAFDGASNEELVRARLLGPPASLRHRRIGVRSEADAVIGRALAIDPARRYASAGEFARALAAATETTGDRTSALAAIPGGIPPARRLPLPRFDSTVALLAVLAILLATVLFFASFPKVLPAVAPAATPAPSGSPPARVSPNVVGRRLADAIETLRGAGYAIVAWDVAQGASGATCTVARQAPPAGTTITSGQTATLYYVAGKDCTKKGD